MKTKILFILGTLIMSLSLQAQAPEKFNYQGIARDNTGAALANQALGLKISILSGTTVEYVETHSVTTNDFGLYSLAIGDGNPVSGTMSGIDWSSGSKSVKVEIDPSGGSNYTDLGTTELLSVPFALYAAESAGENSWKPTGNTADPNDFIGTTNDEALRFKVNGLHSGVIVAGTPFNTSFGHQALYMGTPGSSNSAFGHWALHSNGNSGSENSAFGRDALYYNVDGSDNSAFGANALRANTSGGANSGFGVNALNTNTTGIGNSAFGFGSLQANTTGNNNTALGHNADVGTGNLENATAIGADAFVEQDNSLILGSIAGINSATASVNVGIGTTTPSASLEIKKNSTIGLPQIRLWEDDDDFARINFHNSNPGGWALAGYADTAPETSAFNVFYDDGTGGGNILSVHGHGKVGVNYSPTTAGLSGWSEGTLSVKGAGGSTDVLSLIDGGSTDKWGFWVNNNLELYFNGSNVGEFDDISGAYTTTSDRRLKENIVPVSPVVDKIKEIKIVSYTYKKDKTHQPQIGYIAQNLEKQFPEFVSKPDDESEREDYYTVNYAGMSAVAIKAIQEQQKTIENLQKTIKIMQARLDALEQQ